MTRLTATWQCEECGSQHDDVAWAFAMPAPDQWARASEAERETGEFDPDSCIITVGGVVSYFIRGHLELPVLGSDLGPFTWSVWVSVSQEDMLRAAQTWEDRARARVAPMACWLANELPYQASTVMLPGQLVLGAPGAVPAVRLHPAVRHPLIAEQEDGITRHRVAELGGLLRG
jgi:hypothetical protein